MRCLAMLHLNIVAVRNASKRATALAAAVGTAAEPPAGVIGSSRPPLKSRGLDAGQVLSDWRSGWSAPPRYDVRG